MKNLNTRRWSTPATMGAGLFVITTGLLMFFVTEGPFKVTHELAGIVFSAAVVFHVLSNWRPFTNYFSHRTGLAVLVLAWSIGSGMVVASSVFGIGEPEELVIARISSTPIARLAPLVDLDVGELADRLEADGFAVDDPSISIEQLAVQFRADADDVLFSVFR